MSKHAQMLSTPRLEKPLASETKWRLQLVRVRLGDVCAMLVCLCDCPARLSCSYGEESQDPASVRPLSFGVLRRAGRVLLFQVGGRPPVLGAFLHMPGISRMIGFVLQGSNGEERRRCLRTCLFLGYILLTFLRLPQVLAVCFSVA